MRKRRRFSHCFQNVRICPCRSVVWCQILLLWFKGWVSVIVVLIFFYSTNHWLVTFRRNYLFVLNLSSVKIVYQVLFGRHSMIKWWLHTFIWISQIWSAEWKNKWRNHRSLRRTLCSCSDDLLFIYYIPWCSQLKSTHFEHHTRHQFNLHYNIFHIFNVINVYSYINNDNEAVLYVC